MTIKSNRPESGKTEGGDWSISPPRPDFVFRWEPGNDPVSRAEVAAFYRSKPIAALRATICEIGRRLWEKSYVDGNGGNVSVRVGDKLALCTPTLVSKRCLTPEDICLVDLDGRQKAGTRPGTSEILTHLAVMKNSAARSCIHAHPVHAGAFLVSGLVPPTGILAEPEIFLGEIGFAPYAEPGGPEVARTVGELAKTHQCVFMESHGVLVWGDHIEDAYWKIENVDAYCRLLLLQASLGVPLRRVSPADMRGFIAIRRKLGMPDDRAARGDAELFVGSEFAGRPIIPIGSTRRD